MGKQFSNYQFYLLEDSSVERKIAISGIHLTLIRAEAAIAKLTRVFEVRSRPQGR